MPVIGSSTSSPSTTLINKNSRAQENYLDRIASGKKINKASDNAAGLAVATKLLGDVSVLRQASSNIVQGLSVLQTADGALQQSGEIVERLKSLATQANNGSLDSTARGFINEEYQGLLGELNTIAGGTNFNGTQLLNGSFNQNFQVGADSASSINVNLTAINASSLGLGLSAANGSNANALTTTASASLTSVELDTALNNINNYRAQIGSLSSQFQTRGQIAETQTENLEAAQSAILDADIARESTNFRNSTILTDLSIASATQGNRLKSSYLSILR